MDISEIFSRFKKSWNVFRGRDAPDVSYFNYGEGYTMRPDRTRLSYGKEKSIVTSVFNKIAIDVSEILIKHVRLDENDRYIATINSGLNDCFNLSANEDQTGRAFKMDIVMSMLDEGTVVLLPTDTDDDVDDTNSYDILSMRTAKVKQWYPYHVRVEAYDERDGKHKEITVPKDSVAIIENPLYAVVNEPNSTLQRLMRKLTLLDAVDEKINSSKLDLIIQLPYAVRGELKKKQAVDRRKSIEDQLIGSKYGIAYIDSTEKITQLNRPVENNLMAQVEYLTNMLYSQLGITQGILDGSADEKTMLNYYNRTIEPIVSAIADELKRKFLTKTARSQGQSILYFRDMFKLVPAGELADLADKYTRNEILSANEVRQIIGMKPSDDPNADVLRNKNLYAEGGVPVENQNGVDLDSLSSEVESQRIGHMAEFDELDGKLDELERSLG